MANVVKSRAKVGGRVKGTPNKLTADTRNLILAALDSVGGKKYLMRQAIENPSAFLSLVGKCLPKDINVGGQTGNPVVTRIELAPLE